MGARTRRSYQKELDQIVSFVVGVRTEWTWFTFQRLSPWPSLACWGHKDGEPNSVSLTIVSEGLAAAIH